MNRKIFFSFFIIIFVSACSNSSLEDFREEAEGINRTLLKELQTIHSRQEAVQRIPRLHKLFCKLVDVMIAAEEFKLVTGKEAPSLSNESHHLSNQLLVELTRLYAIEGVRDVIEKSQIEALYKLDAFLQKTQLASKLLTPS